MTRLMAEAIERFLADEGLPPEAAPRSLVPRDTSSAERLTAAPDLDAAPSRAEPAGPAW